LPKARELLTIKCDVPLPAKVEDLAPRPPQAARLSELLERFELRNLKRELQEGGAQQAPASAQRASAGAAPGIELLATAAEPLARTVGECEYETVVTDEQLSSWAPKLEGAELAAIAVETTSVEPLNARLVGLAVSVEHGCSAYLPLAHRYAGAPEQLPAERVLARLKPWLEDPARAKVGQNLKYDMHVLANHGIRLAGVRDDTLLESYVLESHKSHDMDNLAERHLALRTITYDE